MQRQAEARRAVVTGAASGIGRAVALSLRDKGIAVTAVDLNARGLHPLEQAGCSIVAADLTDPAARDALAERCAGADYLVNAAGIIRVTPILEVSLDEWREIQTTNAESIFFLCQRLGARLRPGGAIVNLSSSSAKLAGSTDVAAYAASKTTILSITRSFAQALAPQGIRVNAICPGIVDTPMQDDFLAQVAPLRQSTAADLDAQRKRAVPLGRSASADECAGAIWFLLSDASAYMTGQAINFTGGMVTW